MESAIIIKDQEKNYMKLVKNNKSSKEESIHRIYINTLEPYFKYKNSKGDEVIPISSLL
jgi:hypothetical protein